MRHLVEERKQISITAASSPVFTPNEQVVSDLLDNQQQIAGSCTLVTIAQLSNDLHRHMPLPDKDRYLEVMEERYGKEFLKPGTLDVRNDRMEEAMLTIFPDLGVRVTKIIINNEGEHEYRGSFKGDKLPVVKANNPKDPIDTSNLKRPYAEITHQYLGNTTHFIGRTNGPVGQKADTIAQGYYDNHHHPIVAIEVEGITPRRPIK